MLKKFLIFLCLFNLLFSYELSIYVTDPHKNPVADAYVSLGNLVKKTDSTGHLEISSNEETDVLIVEKSPYRSQTMAIKPRNQNSINIQLKENYDFYLNIYEDTDFNYTFSENSLSKSTLKESMVNFYKDDTFVFSLDYFGDDLGFDLKKGEYTVVIYTLFTSPFVINNLKFDSRKDSYLNINIPVTLSKVSGNIISGDTLLGGVSVTFKDKNREIKAISDIEGNYSATLPSSFYQMTLNKFGYETIMKTIKIDEDKITLSDTMKELASVIKGRIVDSSGKGIPNQRIDVKNNDKSISVQTDLQGYYQTNVFVGLAFIKISIPGFFPTGRVEKIDTLSTKIVPDIQLVERISSLNGNVTDGILPVANIPVKLFDIQGNYFGMSKTDSRGFFKFEKIRSGVEYYISIDDTNFSNYKSQTFVNEDNQNKNFTVILSNSNLNFILELKTTKTIEFSKLNVYINNIKFQADKNGIINNTIKSIKEIQTLEIEIPSLGIKNTYSVADLGSEPYLITLSF